MACVFNLLCERVCVHLTALSPPNLNRNLLAAEKPLIGKIKGSVSKPVDFPVDAGYPHYVCELPY